MRYFDYTRDKSIFYITPEEIEINAPKEILSRSLGATLYMAATRGDLIKDVINCKAKTVVICLEDAVASDEIEKAEKNVISFFNWVKNEGNLQALPLLFIRIRDKHQLERVLKDSELICLCGFVLPKFEAIEGRKILELIIKQARGFYVMPIIETPRVIFKETRIEELLKIKELLDEFKTSILNIRVGGTDLSGIYGLRRNKDMTIYDLAILKDCIGDIINIFKRDNYVVSAPVNEYFKDNFEMLVKEITLDKANGLLGKTAIHPKQVEIINALMVVTKEEYLDAEKILNCQGDGVVGSIYANKMNEIKPHIAWAREIMLLSKITGVLEDGRDFRDLLI